MKNIINFIQFVRGCEPRDPDLDLVKPVVEQTALLQKYHFKGTMLLQYDALIRSDFQKIAKDAADFQEIGLWLEIVQPLVESVGLKWRGRPGFIWDWHSHCDTLVGYSPEERYRLLDKAMETFYEVFGFLPKSVGAWVLDSVSLAYLKEKYGIVAACTCKEQYGTDGYTLWGGNGVAYYPSRKNILSPAQSAKQQINVPVFRMLGPDPIYQYDVFLRKDLEKTDVITLEPGTGIFGGQGGGFNRKWVDWYFHEIYSDGRGISFAYSQTGQENSFGWDAIGASLPYQAQKIAELRDKGELAVLTLRETGEWFLSNFPSTPSTTQAALRDWRDEGRKSVWYYSARYRANLMLEDGEAGIRDCYLFDEEYPERYISEVCTGEACNFDNLPIWDGMRWNNGSKASTLRFTDASGIPLRISDFTYREEKDCAFVDMYCEQGRITAEFLPEEVRFSSDFKFRLIGNADADKIDVILNASEQSLDFTYRGYRYAIALKKGKFADKSLCSEDNRIVLSFAK